MKSIQSGFLFLLWVVMLAIGPMVSAKAASVVTTEQVKAELLVHAPEGLRPGAKAWLGLKIVHKKGWHTYWLNPGDSGLPTQLQWQLPAGLKAGEIEWPVPQRLPIGPLMNHGYEGTLLLAVPLTVERALPEAPLKVQLRADWLVCEDVCIPEGGDFSLTLPAGAARSSLVKDSALFDQARARLPVDWPGARATAQVDQQGLSLELRGLPPAWQGRKLAIFPMAAHVLSPSMEPRAQWATDGAWAGTLSFSPQRMEGPAEMGFVVALEQQSTKGAGVTAVGESSPVGIVLTAAVAGTWPSADVGNPAGTGAPGAGPTVGGLDATGSGPAAATPKADSGWWTAAVLALLGGLILNLMPCVFPVLSLKVFGFAADAHNRRALALGGVAYSLWVGLSFVALAAVLLALRASGEQLGWGFQLQSPPFVAALALLFTLMGMNLLGQFEFAMMVPSRWAAARARHPVVDHFLTGVLAVVVASPCTAPFMGASLGVAVTLPTLPALGIFVALGLGMAAPYLLLSLMPGWAARLPRPGAWMLKVKHAMALPMLATVVWLLWVLGHQAGVDAVAALLGLLLLLAFGIGAWGWAAGLSAGGRLASRAVVLAVVLGTAAWAWPLLQAQPDTKAASADARSDWAPWSPQAMAQELEQGRTVFVDYTAAWCVTCQANKRTTLRRDEVMQALRARDIVTMEADWTRQDETITRELTRLGRTGVPVYAFYRSGADPVLLPEVLTPALMLKAIDDLPR
ncbi:MAG: protein-disulfide reductase DsbD family protein [Burkholderiaceae bacterium]